MRRRILVSLVALTVLILTVLAFGAGRAVALVPAEAILDSDPYPPTFSPTGIKGEQDATTLQCIAGGSGCGSIPW